jgi:poly(glycerol-phosphate) alpha-glucosyltransferase
LRSNLVYLTDSLTRAAGGLFDAVRSLALEVEKHQRYAPAVIGLDDPDAELDRFLWGRIDTTVLPVLGPRAFGYAPGLLETLQSKEPDLVHVHGLWMYPSLAVVRWSRRSKPYVVSPHGMLDSWALKNSRWKKQIAAAVYENRHLHGAACLHALNQAEAKAIRAYGLRNPICVIPNGIGIPEKWEERAERETHTLLYLGRLHPKKGLAGLIEAWSMVRRKAEQAGWRLKIAGWDQSGHRTELEALTRKLGAGSSVSFLGPRFGEAKAECFREASAFILPSLSEGLPMTILEAWSWRLPVIMTPECNLSEGEDAGASIMARNGIESLSAALSRLFSMNKSELEAMGAKGLRLVEDQFQWPRVAQQMTAVYDWILGFSPKPDCVLN